jgi:hypothetical protein
MTETTLDSLPVASLQQRYGISRSVLYERINALQISSEKRGNKAYVNAEQIELLDNLHAFLQNGGSTADFLASAGLSTLLSGDDQLATQSALLDAKALAALVVAIAQQITPSPVASPVAITFPLANLEALERATTNGWLLSTSQLAPLLGLKTLTGKALTRYGFTCQRVGKNGTESAWSVSKVESAG